MSKHDLPKWLKLRRMHGSLYVTIPREYVYAHDLAVHDDILWQPEADGIKLRVVREPTTQEPA
jgi:hypothetical protein